MKKEKENIVVNFFKSENSTFINACKAVALTPTRRQASKWLMKKGKAYKEGR